jgi:hypothetical protein
MEGNPVKGGGSTRTRGGDPGVLGSGADAPLLEEEIAGVTLEELREFLEADHLDVPADPGFKERLRQKLWELVLARTGKPSPDDEL